MKNYVLAGVVVVATVLGVSYVSKPNVTVSTPTPVVNVSVPEQKTPVVNVQAPNVNVTTPKQPQLGSVTGPDLYNKMFFYSGAVFSSTFATTSTGAGTLTYNDIEEVTTILSTNAGALTLTMPASTTLRSLIPKAGDRTQIIIVNQGTALLTLAGGTGTLLQTASSTYTVNIGGSAMLNLVRKTNTDIIVNMAPAI